MAIKNKSLLKTYFQSGSRPTQQNFADLIDSFAHVTDTSALSPINEPIPIDPSVTQNDVGKLAMLDFDGNIKVYQETPERPGTPGKWKLTFNALSQEWNKFQYTDLNRDVEISSAEWKSGASAREEEAGNFIAHINGFHDNALLAEAGANAYEVILTQANAFFMESENDIRMMSNDITLEEVQEPVAHIPPAAKRICLGIIKQVDTINNLGYFDNIYVMQAESAPDIQAVLEESEQMHVFHHLFSLIRLVACPANNGKVKRLDFESLFENGDSTYLLSSLQNAMYIFIKPHHVTGRYYVMKRLLG